MAKRNKATQRTAPATANDIPEGMERVSSGNAPTWKPEEGESLHGVVTDGVKVVEFTQKRKVKGKMVEETVERRVFELEADGNRHAVWESAALVDLFEKVEQHGPGLTVFIRFDGYGKKKPGQNAPKLFTCAVAA